jgi:MarR family transcriptional regulator, lower aerobic nicotinate degradation pathway regulator
MTISETPIPKEIGPSRELLRSTPFLLKRLGTFVRDRSIAAFGARKLSGPHFAVLSILAEGARETQATIADALGYDRSHLVGLLDELESENLIERRRDLVDRRRHVVSLTPAGKSELRKLRAISRQVEEDFLAPLDAEERRTLHELLLKLTSRHDPRCASAYPDESSSR